MRNRRLLTVRVDLSTSEGHTLKLLICCSNVARCLLVKVTMKLQKDKSVFSYSLSRPYPFTWFTYVATVGGIVCATLFTFVALAADGYNTSLEYRRDLNRTLNESEWFQKAPFSWISKLENSCQPAQLALGSVYYTSNLGLRYSLDQLWHESSPGARKHLLPAASYLHTVLEDCDVRSIEVQLNRGQDVSEYQRWAWTAAVPSVCPH